MRDWTEFPPKQDYYRLAQYRRHEHLFRGREPGQWTHRYLGASMFGSIRRKIQIIANFPGLISKIMATLLCGEPPKFSLVRELKDTCKCDGECKCCEEMAKAQEVLDKIVEDNDLTVTAFELGLSSSFRGDSVLRVRWGERHCGEEPQVIIEEVPAFSYFPEICDDNIRQVDSQAIAWVRPDGIFRVQTHTPGLVVEQAFSAQRQSVGESLTIGGEIPLSAVYGAGKEPPAVQETGVGCSLVFFMPNWRIGSQYFGFSDYHDSESHFEAINNRLSRIDSYLDRHASPKMVGLSGMSKPDGSIDFDEFEYIETNLTELAKVLPRYLTWDGQMDSSFKELEVLTQQLMMLQEIAPALFGLDKANSVESGRAMRIRYAQTISKVNRKRLYFERMLKRAIRAALDLYQLHVPGAPDLSGRLEILWQDGLPRDEVEQVAVATSRVTAGLQSKETAICLLDGVAPSKAQQELERIEAEKELAGPDGLNESGSMEPGGDSSNGPGVQQQQQPAAAGDGLHAPPSNKL